MTRQPSSDDVDDDDLFRSFAASGDRRIRNVLVERHTGLAVHIAQRFSANRGNLVAVATGLSRTYVSTPVPPPALRWKLT